jgi:hypothetical protein
MVNSYVSSFAYKFNMRRYNKDPDGGELPEGVDIEEVLCGRCGDGQGDH